ncbi:hypothetical protein HOK68_05210 [Candidatus Woesearchaeota archaeon]|jgi:hypothetical protein|nr:hypothetical protein [Candidatus Woesearchaeota archaeon]MBT4387217.1 hypothetical protein [Candidatus Woesearchaeota archaeon]MBT4596219.1 hypothetical protein [Candidatus Woesearchaeota archaeon]MBT5741558.1 hypothetical protein [Candidatus Woesearchaeota archaeon]MBT6506148.1 hypothetical protein [Candidatus Woesearchaeota archaeon]
MARRQFDVDLDVLNTMPVTEMNADLDDEASFDQQLENFVQSDVNEDSSESIFDELLDFE